MEDVDKSEITLSLYRLKKSIFGVSSSGKSIIIGSTEGNVSIPEKEDIKIGVNVYRKA